MKKSPYPAGSNPVIFPQIERDVFPHLPKILTAFGDQPCHIYHEASIRGQLRRLKRAFSSQDIPFKEYFAVKALPRNRILEIVHSENGGFDCSSISELRRARAVGAAPHEIMFTSNCTSKEEFEEAYADGGCIVNIDDEIFLKKLPKPFPETFCCRLNPGLMKTGDAVNAIIGNPVEAKFGEPIESILQVYEKARKLGADKFILHTMICSGDLNYKNMVNTWKLCHLVGARLWKRFGIKLDSINVGGGVGIVYRPWEEEFNLEALPKEGKVLNDAFSEKYYPAPGILMESGRWITGPCGIYVNRVINVYKKYKKFVGVQSAMPGSPRRGIYPTAYHHPIILNPDGTRKGGRKEVVTICGSNCEGNDNLAVDVLLPVTSEGDLVVMCCNGAHCIGMTSNYNERPRPQELLYGIDDVVELICRAETYEDLIRREQGLEGPEHRFQIGPIRKLAV
jgi:diaminopimelate decarboxylase